jgi:hypothetical protein
MSSDQLRSTSWIALAVLLCVLVSGSSAAAVAAAEPPRPTPSDIKNILGKNYRSPEAKRSAAASSSVEVRSDSA